jgi:hypothetical protein
MKLLLFEYMTELFKIVNLTIFLSHIFTYFYCRLELNKKIHGTPQKEEEIERLREVSCIYKNIQMEI